MSLLRIYTYPDPVLAETAKEIGEITEEIKQLASDMAETMYEGNGIGLAAPQVGKSVRLVVLDITGPEERKGLMQLINPVIVARDGEVESEEGCLSLPLLSGKVARSEKVTVQYRDLAGNDQTIEADELLAICLQHELDHLDGVLLLNHLSRLKRSMYEKKAKKMKEKEREAKA